MEVPRSVQVSSMTHVAILSYVRSRHVAWRRYASSLCIGWSNSSIIKRVEIPTHSRIQYTPMYAVDTYTILKNLRTLHVCGANASKQKDLAPHAVPCTVYPNIRCEHIRQALENRRGTRRTPQRKLLRRYVYAVRRDRWENLLPQSTSNRKPIVE